MLGVGSQPEKYMASYCPCYVLIEFGFQLRGLCEFFNCFKSSTRLLRIKGAKATFPNICASIQNLADRFVIQSLNLTIQSLLAIDDYLRVNWIVTRIQSLLATDDYLIRTCGGVDCIYAD